jgi:hypothetical protein
MYWTKSLPEHWVVEDDDGKLWLMPVIVNGWQQRKPYRGHKKGLHQMTDAGARLNLQLGGAHTT